MLALVALGQGNKEIARTLGIKESTVKYHVGNILGKLGVPSRVAAARYARDLGLPLG